MFIVVLRFGLAGDVGLGALVFMFGIRICFDVLLVWMRWMVLAGLFVVLRCGYFY